jgi:FkbM family methyltransferase
MCRKAPNARPRLRRFGREPGPFTKVASRWIASHDGSRITSAARRVLYEVTAILHTENHDPTTNGELSVLRGLGTSAACILDVGANSGAWALMAARECPAAVIHCFEIASQVRAVLEDRVAKEPRIVVASSGLLDFEGTVPVKQYPDDSEVASITDYPHNSPSVWRCEPVSTGDKYVEMLGIARIDLLKIDAEGADLRILHGFRRALQGGRIAAVQFEYGFAGILTGALLYRFYEYLEPLGFAIGRVQPAGVDFQPYQLIDERFFGPNYLAVCRDQS